MSYRLARPEPLPRLCIRHLRGADRILVAFQDNDRARVVLVGPDTDDPNRNVDDRLYALIGATVEPSERRTKPPCCDEEGAAPVTDEELVTRLARRTRDVFGK
jgi:hypothetical protein